MQGLGTCQDTRTAEALFLAGCKAGHGLSCEVAGELAAAGGSSQGVTTDPIAAKVLFQQACQHGVKSSCAQLARTVLIGSPFLLATSVVASLPLLSPRSCF